MPKPSVFISYSHKDEDWKDRLVTHLRVLEKQNMLSIWEDRQIKGGDDWKPEIEDALNYSQIAILMISAHFLSSNFILGEEVPRIMKRRKDEGIRVIPLIVKPCAWTEVDWLRSIQARPKDGRTLSGGNENQIDIDLSDLTKEIARLVSRRAIQDSPDAPESLPPDKITLSKLPTTKSKVFGREIELAILDKAWANSHTNIISFVAWGGVGKTALVNEWLSQIEKHNYRGAQRVYGWSFYSQGTPGR